MTNPLRGPALATAAQAVSAHRNTPGIGLLFVLLWSTGFIGAKLGLPYAEPLTFLALRMGLVVALLLVVAIVARAPWPRGARAWVHITIAGLLVQFGYLGGVFSAIHHGMSAGVVALIVGLQPILTAVAAAPLFGERTTSRQWAGLALGLVGVTSSCCRTTWRTARSRVPASCSLSSRWSASLPARSIRSASARRWIFAPGPSSSTLRPASCCLLLAALTESMHVTWSGQFVFALAWLAIVLSVGAISLLYFLIKRGKATQVSSLFYLTPPVTARAGVPLLRRDAVAGSAGRHGDRRHRRRARQSIASPARHWCRDYCSPAALSTTSSIDTDVAASPNRMFPS